MTKTFYDIVELSRYLRSPEGCPWDREQTLSSLRTYILEEAYEVIQAIELEDKNEIIEELGDFLFQVVFASQIGSEEKLFDINDVINELHNKLIRRHPHVFGEVRASSADEAVKSWQTEKLKEKTRKRKLLEIPRAMPSLLRGQRVGEKASQVGFDWDNIHNVIKKVREELEELEEEIVKGNDTEAEKEFGDLVFAICNLSRHMKIDAEISSHAAIDKFVERFGKVEDEVQGRGKKITDLSLEELDQIWNEIKKSN